MILTVTPDPVLDRIFIIEEWTPGVPANAYKTTLSVGGKGLDSSVALRHLGQETNALTFLAGKTGHDLAQMIEDYGIDLEAVWADGETRSALVISEARHNRHTHVFSGGLKIGSWQQETFLERFQTHLPGASWVICGGIIPTDLPPEFYGSLIRYAATVGKPVLVDAFRGFMLGALSAGPEVVKMNWKEFEWTFECNAKDLLALQVQMRSTYLKFSLKNLIVTCGPDGILALTSEGFLYTKPPRQEAVNAAGAGDAASAAIAWRRSEGDGWEETLRWAAAVSAAVVLTEGTADCRMEDIHRIYKLVEVSRLADR